MDAPLERDGSQLLRIVLTGFMGAGKSTVGPLLAQRIGWRFFDVDRTITREQAASVAELFRNRGEEAFRALERDAIASLLQHKYAVISLGGGALENAQTRERLRSWPNTHVVFLETSLEVALTRCRRGTATPVRPLLADLQALKARYERRLPHYREAHQTLPSGSRTPEELADALATELGPRLATRHPQP